MAQEDAGEPGRGNMLAVGDAVLGEAGHHAGERVSELISQMA